MPYTVEIRGGLLGRTTNQDEFETFSAAETYSHGRVLDSYEDPRDPYAFWARILDGERLIATVRADAVGRVWTDEVEMAGELV